MKTYGYEDLRGRYEAMASCAIVEARFSTEVVGGMSADREGVGAFVRHHLHLSGQEADDAIARIMNEEIGERDVPSETGELKEKLSYGVNVIRRDAKGPFLLSHMPKACLKTAASRLGIFAKLRGSKGDMAEMGEVLASGISLLDPDAPQKIYLIDCDADVPVTTHFRQFKGRIQSPQGSASIIHDSECAPAGTRFSFAMRYYPGKIREADIVDIMASAMIIGLGSCKAFDTGKFQITKLMFEEGKAPKRGKVEESEQVIAE